MDAIGSKFGRIHGHYVPHQQACDAPGVTFTNGAAVITAKDASLPKSLVNTRYVDFAPRFGFAWRPLGGNRMVVRGGYGIFYGAQTQNLDLR
jgi:hypothetical protein